MIEDTSFDHASCAVGCTGGGATSNGGGDGDGAACAAVDIFEAESGDKIAGGTRAASESEHGRSGSAGNAGAPLLLLPRITGSANNIASAERFSTGAGAAVELVAASSC